MLSTNFITRIEVLLFQSLLNCYTSSNIGKTLSVVHDMQAIPSILSHNCKNMLPLQELGYQLISSVMKFQHILHEGAQNKVWNMFYRVNKLNIELFKKKSLRQLIAAVSKLGGPNRKHESNMYHHL